jgi:selenocysteine lyase/cysteine desulfurase
VRIHGLKAAAEMPERVSTISLTVKGKAPKALADSLAAENIFTWSGDNYALDLIAWLGLAEGGGVLRIGPVHYNTINEVDQTADALAHLIG